MTGDETQPILIAAGGTGGHLFPAQALAEALSKRGYTIHLVTDPRGGRYDSGFPAKQIHEVPADTVRGGPLGYVRAAASLALGTLRAWSLIGRLKPRAVVGFGGYPTVPPILAAGLRRVPTLIHEQNAVIGRANRLLAGRVDRIATSFPEVRGLAKKPAKSSANESAVAAESANKPANKSANTSERIVQTGAPVRAAVIAAASDYAMPKAGGPLRLLVFGGSQGAKVLSEIVPAAVGQLGEELKRRLVVVQQCREEDLAAVRAAYAETGVAAELAPFFADLPGRMAEAHLVVSRSGASTVAELAVIGRPAILVPLPHAIDNDQLLNARAVTEAGGGWMIEQKALTPDSLAAELTRRLSDPAGLAQAATAVRAVGNPRAAEALAELVRELAEGAGGADGETKGTTAE